MFMRDDSRGKVKRIPQPEANPVILQQQRNEEKLSQIQCQVEWEERIRVHVKRVCPFDFGIRRGRV